MSDPMKGHRVPSDIASRASVACENGCGRMLRQPRTPSGVGYVEILVDVERTGPSAGDAEGVWSIDLPPCGGQR